MSVAEEIIRGALDTDGKLDGEHAQDFLNRLFTLRQEVPVHESPDLRDYARDVLRGQAPALAAKLGTHVDDVISMLIYEDVADPRHVVRLINAFSSDYRLALAREQREGRRSLHADAVTAHPDVLARVVVIKTDFARFFKAALKDLALVDIGSRTWSLGEDDAEFAKLSKFPMSENRSLYKFLARTAGWVPGSVDLFPFFYLGQDRFSLTLGNAEARELQSALANNLSVELATLASAAEESGGDAVGLFRELLVSVFRELEDPEITNAASAVIQAARSAPALQDQEIARAVAAAANHRSEAVSDVSGALVLAEYATSEDARILVRLALGVSDDTAEGTIWEARTQVRAVLGEQAFSDWAHSRISDVDSWSGVGRWTREDLGDALAAALIGRAVVLASNPGETAVATEDDFANVVAIAAQVSEQVPVPDMKALRAAIEVGADTLESAIGFESAKAYVLMNQQLADILHSATAAQKSLADDAEPVREMQDGVAAVTIRMTIQKPEFGYWEDTTNPRSVASVGSSLLAGWLDTNMYPASLALPALTAMVNQKAKTHTSLAKAMIDAWIRNPGGLDAESVPYADTVQAMVRLMPLMEETASTAVVDAWVAALGDEDSRAFVSGLAPSILTAGAPTEWGDKAMAELVPLFQRGLDYSTDATEAAALVMATGRLSVDCEQELLRAFEAILPYGGAHRVRGLTSLAQLPWSAELSSEVAATVTPYVSEAPEEDYWTLFDLFVTRGVVDTGFVAHIDTYLAADEPTDAMKAHAHPLARVLSLENAMELALTAESEDAMAAVAHRALEADEVDPTIADLLRKIAALPSAIPARVSFAHAFAAADYDVYVGATHILLADTLDVGGASNRHLWAFVTVPLESTERRAIWAEVEPKLISSAREASAASIVLAATGTDDEFDQIVSKGIGNTMLHWISEEPDAVTAAVLGAAVCPGRRSRAAALIPAKRSWRTGEKKVAASAALKALS